MRQSAGLLCLPVPPADMLETMIRTVTKASEAEVPAAPGSLYLRPTLVGTEENVGAAAAPWPPRCCSCWPVRWVTTSRAASAR